MQHWTIGQRIRLGTLGPQLGGLHHQNERGYVKHIIFTMMLGGILPINIRLFEIHQHQLFLGILSVKMPKHVKYTFAFLIMKIIHRCLLTTFLPVLHIGLEDETRLAELQKNKRDLQFMDLR